MSSVKRQKLFHYSDSDILLQRERNFNTEVHLSTQKLEESEQQSRKSRHQTQLLTYGTDVNSKWDNHQLHQYALGQSSSLLFRQGTDADADCTDGEFTDLFELVMEGYDVNTRLSSENNSLYDAILKGQSSEVEDILLNSSCSPTVDHKCVQLALQALHTNLVDILLDTDAGEVNCKDVKDPLHLIALNSRLKIVKLLIEFGNGTNTIRHTSSSKKVPDVAENFSILNDDWEVPSQTLLSFLMCSGSEVNSSHDENLKPLHSQSRQRLIYPLQLLLINGDTVNCFQCQHFRPLHVVFQ